MKKLIFISALALGILAVGGCEEEKQTEHIYPILNIPETVKLFFNEELPKAQKSSCFFKSNQEDCHYLISSTKELQSFFSCKKKLPDIDFADQILIIGQKSMPNSYYQVKKQYIIHSDALELIIITELLGEGSWPAFSTMYYWGFYPKLPNKKININVKM